MSDRTHKRVPTARVVTRESAAHCLPGALLEPLATLDSPAMLDSTALDETYGRYTVLACQPLEVITLRQGALTDHTGRTLAAGDNEAIWAALAEVLASVRAHPDSDAAPYAPGWIGYVGYEVGRHIERLPARAARDTALPDLRLAFYDSLLVYDAMQRAWALVRLSFDGAPIGAGRSEQTLRELLAAATHDPTEPAPRPSDQADATARPIATDARSPFTQRQYEQAVQRCIDYIAAGDIF